MTLSSGRSCVGQWSLLGNRCGRCQRRNTSAESVRRADGETSSSESSDQNLGHLTVTLEPLEGRPHGESDDTFAPMPPESVVRRVYIGKVPYVRSSSRMRSTTMYRVQAANRTSFSRRCGRRRSSTHGRGTAKTR